MATYAEMLSAAKTALAGIVASKTASYSVNGVSYTYHNLADLEKLIDWLETKAARESGSRPMVVVADISRRAD